MAQSNSKRSSGPARSTSSPPALASARLQLLQQHSDPKTPAPPTIESCRANVSETATPVSTTTTSSIISTISSSNISSRMSPLSRSAQSGSNETSRKEGEGDDDYVEGGIELEPAGKEGEGASDEAEPELDTRPLPPLGDPELEEFWPAGDGPRALFLDYDGTLREFEARPELATPTPALNELLSAINARKDFQPHIISGRDARFLETYFGHLNRFTLIAEHGFQIWRPGTPSWTLWEHPDGLDKDHDDWKEIVRGVMNKYVLEMPGSHVEEKVSSLVWHYREVADAPAGEEAACRAIEELEAVRERENIGKIRISAGHKVVEVSYRKVRKGPVMRRICEDKALFGEPFLSVFVAGDDTSDESMFDIAPDDFLTVKVGPALTHAKFRVDSPSQLRNFLQQLTL